MAVFPTVALSKQSPFGRQPFVIEGEMNEADKWLEISKGMDSKHAFIYKAYRHLYIPKRDGKYVYLIQLGETDVYKIGLTNNLEKRLGQLQAKCPIPLAIIYWWWGHDFDAFERCLHLKYECKKVKGEWFKLTSSDLMWIISTYPMECDPRIQDNAN
jgi:hypothetical protein